MRHYGQSPRTYLVLPKSSMIELFCENNLSYQLFLQKKFHHKCFERVLNNRENVQNEAILVGRFPLYRKAITLFPYLRGN